MIYTFAWNFIPWLMDNLMTLNHSSKNRLNRLVESIELRTSQLFGPVIASELDCKKSESNHWEPPKTVKSEELDRFKRYDNFIFLKKTISKRVSFGQFKIIIKKKGKGLNTKIVKRFHFERRLKTVKEAAREP